MGSSTDSLAASRSRASISSPEAEMEKNVDSLFKVYTIPEVTKTLSKLKLENTRLKSNLFSMVGENYNKILEAADAVQSMKQHAEDMQKTLDLIQSRPSHTDGQQSEKNTSIGTKRKELDSMLKQIMTCSTEAWKLFKVDKMAAAVDLCTDTLALLGRNRHPLQQISMPALLNCMELQIAQTQTRLKHMAAEKLFNEDLDYSQTNIEMMREALLLHSGLHSKTHYSSEDLANAFMVCWKSMKATPDGTAALRQAVLKNVQMLVFGQAILSTRHELKDLFSHRIKELSEETNQPVVIDKALIEAMEIMKELKASQQKCLEETSLQVFSSWLNKKCETIIGDLDPMQCFKLVVDFQNTYGFSMNSEPLKMRAEELRKRLGNLEGFDSVNILLPALHPGMASLPPKKSELEEQCYRAVPVLSVNFL